MSFFQETTQVKNSSGIGTPMPGRFSADCNSRNGGRDRDRTGAPLLAKQVLSQLSYTPTVGVTSILKHFRRFQNPFLRFSILWSEPLFGGSFGLLILQGKRPERKSGFRSGPLRSEVELQTKLDVARVAGAPEASEIAGGDRQGRVAKTTQGIVRPIEYVKEV